MFSAPSLNLNESYHFIYLQTGANRKYHNLIDLDVVLDQNRGTRNMDDNVMTRISAQLEDVALYFQIAV